LAAPVAGLAAAALLTVSLASCTSKVGYAAVVNGTQISQESINQELADVARNRQYVQLVDQQDSKGPVGGSSPGSYNKVFVAALLDQAVRFEIVRQWLAGAGALPAQAKVAAAKTAISGVLPAGVFAAFPTRYQNVLATQQAEADAFVSAVTSKLSPDDLNSFYQAHLGDYVTEACVRHILFAHKDPSGRLDYPTSLAGATTVKGLLDTGGDFVALAKQYSQDNQGANGGGAAQGGVFAGTAADGCLAPQDLQQLGPDFTAAVVSLPLNQLSNPVKSMIGYHLVEVISRVIEPLDDAVTTNIRERLAGQRLTDFVAKAKVKVNPEFGSFDQSKGTTGQVNGVVPPLVPNLTPGGAAAASPTSPTSTPTSSSGG